MASVSVTLMDGAISALVSIRGIVGETDPTQRRSSPSREYFLTCTSALNFGLNALRLVRMDLMRTRDGKASADECASLIRDLLTVRTSIERGEPADGQRGLDSAIRRAQSLRRTLSSEELS